MSDKLRITYKKSAIGYNKRQKATIKALGFRKLNQTVVHDDTPAIRGMVNCVSHLLVIEEEK
jgi:large subunit ribosomal protein L30